MNSLMQMWICRKLLVRLMAQYFYVLNVAASVEGIAWKLQTIPAVFGSDVVLECILPSSTCCDRYTRRWLGGGNLNLLIMDGISSKPDKYSEEFTKESRSSKLTIHSLDSKDVNIPYQCTYGFSKDVKLLNMTDYNFENYPVEPTEVNITKNRGNVFQVCVVLQPVLPEPKCNASTDVLTSGREVDISKSIKISSVRKGLFYTATIKIIYTLTEPRCQHLLNINCQIGTKLFEIHKNMTCSSEIIANDVNLTILKIILSIVLVTAAVLLLMIFANMCFSKHRNCKKKEHGNIRYRQKGATT